MPRCAVARFMLVAWLAAALASPVAVAGAATATPSAAMSLPWRAAGLDERQAAAHLLDRLAYGARPGDIDRVVGMGLEAWLAAQLRGDLADPVVAAKLAGLRSLALSNREIVATYPPPGQVVQAARRAGVILEETAFGVPPEETADEGSADRRRQRGQVEAWARGEGYRSQRELLAESMTRKIVRGVYSENQLHEVLTDFWFNHFNVALTDNQARPFVPTYERDAIRPHVLGSFRALLEASAKHPAMLLYLDNAQSTANEGVPTTLERKAASRWSGAGADFGGPRGRRSGMRGRSAWSGGGMGARGRGPSLAANDARRRERPRGLNENFARELLELHTLGVDGGYAQQDVIEVARALSGWTINPLFRQRLGGQSGPPGDLAARLDGALRADLGFVREGDFLFRADAHDAGAKTVLGTRLPAGRGVEDGEQVLDLVAMHPATARHIARKLAARFVTDDPPAALVERLANIFVTTGGDLRQVVVALVESPEFWAPAARRQKIKSPFELTVSALRALDADVTDPRELIEWLARMGQLPYGYQAPTGFPDRAEHWVNGGALLNRMNFGLQLAAGRIAGVRIDLDKLALPAVSPMSPPAAREPESQEAALATYARLLLPERDVREMLRQLEPVVRDPDLARKVVEAAPTEANDAAGGEPAPTAPDPRRGGKGRGMDGDRASEQDERDEMAAMTLGIESGPLFRRRMARAEDRTPPTPLEQVVGVILGSPEFQRR